MSALDLETDYRRARAVRNGACDAPWTAAPVPGDVGLDKRATCPKCGKRVAVTARGRYANHKTPVRSSP